MNPPKADELDYIHFLIAAQKAFTATEAARSAPENPDPPAHDAFTRLLTREPPDTEALWREARAMLETAKDRGFRPRKVLFDSWYSSLDNLKAIRSYGWHWLCRLKSNRLVNPDKSGNVAIGEVEIPAEGRIVHLKAYGMVRVLPTVARDGGEDLEQAGWGIEVYHRALKHCCGVERAQVRGERAQRNHLGLALRAFLRLEANRLRSGVSWYEAKLSIVREAVRRYLAEPLYPLSSTA